MVAAGAAIFLLWPRSGPQDRLVGDVLADEQETDARPAHAQPVLPQSFGELLAPRLAGLNESSAEAATLGELFAPIVALEAGVESLSSTQNNNLALHRRDFEGALLASHAWSAKAAPSMRIYAAFAPDPLGVAATHAARLAAVDLLIKVGQGRADEALDECADAMAYARDLSYPSVLGRMLGVASLSLSVRACGRAIDRASAAEVAKLREKLAIIRAGTPRFAMILKRESIFARLALTDDDARLPSPARELIADFRAQGANAAKRWIFVQTARPRLETRLNELVAAQSLAWPDCAQRVKEIDARSSWNPLVGHTNFAPLLARHRDGFLALDALICLADLEVGRECAPVEPQATCGEQRGPIEIAGGHPKVNLSDGTSLLL